ncbi:hypothetical protein CKA55_11885 [Arcobacter suis]|uniref:Membrane protein n=1 Tax=Arcobacter suis CECT 7833 TaxID=663365 RepID=A0AAD0WR63_9BACT|nr:hypothetical protein [Arcobacter suis]AXX90449.1 putative membrane protein [Arcobacter suis CECT 7833]RWS45623.1 hypothetical protein CKA55_11885 [Arcobacter suis]
MNNKIGISKFGLLTTFSFFILSFLGRILFPFGDEPDFEVRAPGVLYDEHLWWSPYYLLHDLFLYLNPISSCQMIESRISLYIDIGADCFESIEQITIRLFITLLLISPLLFAITFRKIFISIMDKLNFKLTKKDWNNRLDALSLSLIFPSMIYYLGVFSEEQFTLILSLYIFLFWRFSITILFLVTLIVLIDVGNGIVVFTFIIFAYLFIWIYQKFNFKVSILFMLSIILFAYITGISLLIYLNDMIFLSSKIQSMYENAIVAYDKYPILLRPIITYMTAVFMTANGIKVVIVYILFGVLFCYMLIKLVKNYNHYKQYNYNLILFYNVFTVILFFIFMFPDYTFAKYYMFMMPFILMIFLFVFNKFNVYKIVLFGNFVIFIHLIIYRL